MLIRIHIGGRGDVESLLLVMLIVMLVACYAYCYACCLLCLCLFQRDVHVC